MKRLLLVRHAKSSWDDPDLADIDRPLNKRGKRDAPTMGRRLAERGIAPGLIVSSPAKRARRTALLLAEEIAYPEETIALDERIYEASAAELLDVIRGFDDAQDTALLVGHNPGLTELGNLLTGAGIANIPTCGILCAELRGTSWKELAAGATILSFFDYPKR
ncbi:MAG: phosphohistidine phosphatase [Desulfuromonas sp.]|uniref:SixA phosphatase family protein n=1 Tax=Desulfuromonas sp. TaxID=892 RepID=UPI000CBB31AD|nr:histidine phosphatase family protein [Desulfuromonas sp.]PLX82828.1 MAG: phosphohistidine phosphatase [Desulfuromonas sp.]